MVVRGGRGWDAAFFLAPLTPLLSHRWASSCISLRQGKEPKDRKVFLCSPRLPLLGGTRAELARDVRSGRLYFGVVLTFARYSQRR